MRRRQGVIFIGLVYYAPVRSDGENASAETLVVEARKVIQKELVRRGLGNMTINVEKPVRYEGSSDYVQLLAYAGEMPLDELVRAARAIIDADPLGKQRPAPFYRGRGNID